MISHILFVPKSSVNNNTITRKIKNEFLKFLEWIQDNICGPIRYFMVKLMHQTDGHMFACCQFATKSLWNF